MTLSHPVALISPPAWPSLERGGGGALEEPRRASIFCGGVLRQGCRGVGGAPPRGRSPWRARVGMAEAPAAVVEKGQIRTGVEIPVTCYQILGVSEKAEKDEIVKATMDLKILEIEDGYTADIMVSRQDLLVDVRDKLLFEPQYAGAVKEKIPPKSSLCIPLAWLPAALCLLHEVGEQKLVLEIGRAALQLADVKPYDHDVHLSMALAECSIAKTGFEKCKVAEGFEALARAQYLLRSKVSLGKMPLLSQIEESLEELAPACTLELLGIPHTPDNAERRRGALAALRELLRQGLDVEVSCRVHDWPCFLSHAMMKLLATEVVDLLSWNNLAIIRKNKKSLESQNQRVVVDFSCFYMAMIGHIALGFSTRRIDLISIAKTICECLIVSEGMDLKFEEAFCLLLLGKGDETVAIQKLREIEVDRNSTLQRSESTFLKKDDKSTTHHSLETWLKDTVLCVFPDTRDSSPSLADFFRGPKQSSSKQKTGTVRTTSTRFQPPFLGLSPVNGTSREQFHADSTRHLGEAVQQLAPIILQNQLTVGETSDTTSASSVQLKREGQRNNWEIWIATRNVAGKIVYAMLVGCFVFGTLKLLHVRCGDTVVPLPHKWQSNHPNWTVNHSPCLQNSFSFTGKNIPSRLGELLGLVRQKFQHPTNAATPQSIWPSDDLSATGVVWHKRQMPLEEAECLVKHWQDTKAEALGPKHQIRTLSVILAESMLSKWKDLANSAKTSSCFWKFVLLNLSILRADILLDEVGDEVAEIEAVLEEVAELVDESQTKNPNYHSTYKVQYTLKRQDDGSWRFCGDGIESPI